LLLLEGVLVAAHFMVAAAGLEVCLLAMRALLLVLLIL
jgi:hypothetical protein